MNRLTALSASLISTLLLAFAPVMLPAQEPVLFNRDIRPILSENCFSCHGPDKNKRAADLRLDTEEGLRGADGTSGAIIPGKPEESLLIQRVIASSPEERMPPPESGKELKPEEIEILKRWIAEGGAFEGHWAFLPRRSATHLGDGFSDAAASARIDKLVDAELAKAKLPASPEADKITLLRRVHFDLTGLPPSEQEVEQFLSDDSPDAYERLIDRLLASPHFGERLAIWWLDLVRYADTVGYHGDQVMSVSPFRTYVIESFNANKPFDVFTREQLAGDLFPNPTREHLIASGYNRLGMMSAEGGGQDKEYLAKYMAERVRNASGTWLGVTIGCAECHDHKFDPFTARDFYRFGAFFADIKERGIYTSADATGNWGPYIKVPTPQQEEGLKKLDEQIAAVRSVLSQSTPELVAAQQAWEKEQIPWTTLKPETAESKEGATLAVQPDYSVLASGKSPTPDLFTLTFRNLPAGVTAIRLEVLPHESLPRRGPGRAPNGNFVLTHFNVKATTANGEATNVPLQNATATYEQPDPSGAHPYKKFAIASAISDENPAPVWGWAVDGATGKAHAAVFETKSDLSLDADGTLTIELVQNYAQHPLGRFRIAVTTSPRPLRAADVPPPEIDAILAVAPEARSPEQTEQLAAYYRQITPLLQPKRDELAQLEQRRRQLDASIVTSLITESVPPRTVRILPRGNWMDDSGEVVTPSFPVSLGGEESVEGRLTRLDLANWIVSPDHPLTSRVLANRLWKLYFGAGLSRRLDDLGAQGEWPTHPELLDELAQWIVDSKWDLKRWIKIVLMSKAYRRSSQASAEVRERDPDNRYLARQSRFRLEAELVRDNALAVSGLLVNKLGGVSVFPYQPPGYWAYLNFPQREWQNSRGADLYRRGIYTHWQRQYLHPSLLVFDAPSREECTADRPRSNTPLQSLALLNDPIYVEAARAFAELIMRQEGDDAQKINFAFRRALSRSPSEAETQILSELAAVQRSEYREQPDLAKEITKNGDRPAPTDLDPIELAAWTSVARAILNLHETITRY